jgi:hypothetical protein
MLSFGINEYVPEMQRVAAVVSGFLLLAYCAWVTYNYMRRRMRS